MKMMKEIELEQVLPQEIEKRSFEIITEELGDVKLVPGTEPVVKRCIHTSADFDYAKNLVFSDGVIEHALKVLGSGATIVTDTQMAMAGVNEKKACNTWLSDSVLHVRSGCGRRSKKERRYARGSQHGACCEASGSVDLCNRQCSDRFGAFVRTCEVRGSEAGAYYRCAGRICECRAIEGTDIDIRRCAVYRGKRKKRWQ